MTNDTVLVVLVLATVPKVGNVIPSKVHYTFVKGTKVLGTFGYPKVYDM